ncbi:alpha/beta fold hydrolase [Mesobacterium sp. TK19101]|uniref:Alpha/beta fold hydrolase n=1 Tax=Mesobacterium hydrothermale TaxID=3111907 RepID=A0ABU6HEA0_9RHOB|nr:alpha/beta fold hydrolase [Mesobacterium sp. TK19101]MEC3860790.1 alpha/beta fold hydrolase [Mesobacterium sp. TK19101]
MTHTAKLLRKTALGRITGALLLCCALSSPVAAAETDLTLPGPAGPLGATLSLPESVRAAVLILPGSGPTDRNGNSAFGLKTDTYRKLAEGLADHAIATLRADKRGVGTSGGDGNAVTLDAYARDADLLIDMLRDRGPQTCVWLAGHSEGGLIALKVAQRRDDLCGIILLATPGRPVSAILLEQLSRVPELENDLPMAQKAILQLVIGNPVPVADLPPSLQGLFAPQVQPFLIDLFAHNPTELAQATDLPLLIVQGDADLQIGMQDADVLAQARPDSQRLTLPGMTHVLKTTPGPTRQDNMTTYRDPNLPLTDGLVDAIAGFILDDRP